MAEPGPLAVLVTGKPIPATALDEYGGRALDAGLRLVLYATADAKAPAALDRRIRVRRIRPRGRGRLRSKARAGMGRLTTRGSLRQRLLSMALLDVELADAAREADVIVALDTDAALAVWALARRNPRARAVLGLPELARLAALGVVGGRGD